VPESSPSTAHSGCAAAVEHAGWTACCVPGVVAVHNYLRFEFDDLMITGL
jgi:hypothetical protein